MMPERGISPVIHTDRFQGSQYSQNPMNAQIPTGARVKVIENGAPKTHVRRSSERCRTRIGVVRSKWRELQTADYHGARSEINGIYQVLTQGAITWQARTGSICEFKYTYFLRRS